MLGEILYKFIGFNIRKIANAMRSHWDVENKLHWRLDVAMDREYLASVLAGGGVS